MDANILGIFIFAAEGHIVEANDAFLRMVGYDREDVVAGRLRWTRANGAASTSARADTIAVDRANARSRRPRGAELDKAALS